MDKVDSDVQRIAKQRVWSEAEGTRIVVAWRRSGVSRAAFGRRYGIAFAENLRKLGLGVKVKIVEEVSVDHSWFQDI